MPDTFRALIAEGDKKQYSVDFKDIPHGSLPAGEILIQAMYSSLNYKDGLAITRRGKVIRKFPMVLGVDLAGKVLESNTGEFKAGDEVLVTGQGLGETIWGGYSVFVDRETRRAGRCERRSSRAASLHKCLFVTSALLCVGFSTRRWLARIVRHLHVRKLYGSNESL